MTVALTNCRLLDGTGSPPRDGITIVVRGEHIDAVLTDDVLAQGTRAFSMAGKTVMPGLIDCHIHFALWAFELLDHLDEPISYLHARTLKALKEALEAGCTFARDPGGLDVGFREAINDGLCRGPRLQTSITTVSPTNGITDGTRLQGVPVPLPPGLVSPECNGPDACRAKVRELARAGADFVKIAVSGGVSSTRRSPRRRLFTDEEVAAIVDEAHAWGLPVACHAIGGPGPLAAIRAGVDSVEHGVWLDDECVAEMAERGTWCVPTLTVFEQHRELGAGQEKRLAGEMTEIHRESLARARAAGVKIACGSDTGVYNFDFKRELELLVDAGMTAGEAIVAATSDAAACLNVGDSVGAVQPGLLADLVIVDGDPTTDVSCLTGPVGICGVLQGGSPVHDPQGIFAVPADVGVGA